MSVIFDITTPDLAYDFLLDVLGFQPGELIHSGSILETFPMQFGEIYKMEYWDKETGLSTVVIAD